MIAVDTNILVRLLTRDDPAQFAAVERLFAGNAIMLLTGVLVETEWVLRSRYRWPRQQINAIFADLLATHAIIADHPDAIRWALSRHAEGADLADMCHVAQAVSAGAGSFATFDQALATHAGQKPPVTVIVLS